MSGWWPADYAARRSFPLEVDDASKAGSHARRTRHRRAYAREVALSILAEIVAAQHEPAQHARMSPDPRTSDRTRDPVCGMTVAAVDTSPHVETPTGPVYFCGTGCRTAYLDDPLAYAQ